MSLHSKCKIWKSFWVLGIVGLLVAWYSSMNAVLVFGLGSNELFWSALIFAVLSVPIKLDCHSGGTCE